MMHSRVSNHAHGARRREFRATERGHSRGEIAAAGVRALRAGVPASELLQLSVCDASWPRALLGMALQGLAGSYFFVPVPTAAQTEATAMVIF